MGNLKGVIIITAGLILLSIAGCHNDISIRGDQEQGVISENESFNLDSEVFDEFGVHKYQIPQSRWDSLTLEDKKLFYYLIQAGHAGRDVYLLQKNKHNLELFSLIETIYENFSGIKESNNWISFTKFAKKIWWSKSPFNDYNHTAIVPEFSEGWLNEQLHENGLTLSPEIRNMLFHSETKNEDSNESKSMINFYGDDISIDEASSFYENYSSTVGHDSLEIGLNSMLVRDEKGTIIEKKYYAEGVGGDAIKQMIYWLDKAREVTKSPKQAMALEKLIEYYRTGDLEAWEQYNLYWLEIDDTKNDFINGFIETYNDPLSLKGSYQSLVYLVNDGYSKKLEKLANLAMWFEENAPVDDEYKRDEVNATSMKVVDVIGGEGLVSTQMFTAVSLPNSEWIRREIGSKDFICENIISAMNMRNSGGLLTEFAHDEEEIIRQIAHGKEASILDFSLGIMGYSFGKESEEESSRSLKEFANPVDRTIGYLFSLYYALDHRLVDFGIVDDKEVGRAIADRFFRSGLLVNLRYMGEGATFKRPTAKAIYTICHWLLEQGEAIELVEREGKLYVNIINYDSLQKLVGDLLKKTVAIEVTGDYQAAKKLFEYADQIDSEIYGQVNQRVDILNLPVYTGYMQPNLEPEYDENGEIKEVTISYDKSFDRQMLDLAKEFGHLRKGKESDSTLP